MEKYISIVTEKFRFIDSLQHLNASLDKLVTNLTHGGVATLKHLREYIDEEHEGSEEKFNLLTRKGVYPYSYVTTASDFEDGLPPQSEFHNELTDEELSDSDYNHVQTVWGEFGMECVGDLHDLYVITDVLLLADVLEKYRAMCWTRMGLEALRYVSLPALTFDACLKLTRQKIQIVKDIDILQFIESGIRGGISVISHRHAEANSPLMSSYDPSEPESHLLYIDANNLYGHAMSQKVPVDEIKWVDGETVESWTADNLMAMDPNASHSYILEVDLEIPESIHDSTSDYPLCPEKLKINEDMISPKSREIRVQRGCGGKFVAEKLAPNLLPKREYVVHLRNLQFYLSKGARLTGVRRAISFRQEAWIAPYIAGNTALRQEAVDEFERDFFKLLNNAFFGKTMENVRNRIRIELVNNERRHAWYTSKPTFKRFEVFDDSCWC